jgi:hypothetical protein
VAGDVEEGEASGSELAGEGGVEVFAFVNVTLVDWWERWGGLDVAPLEVGVVCHCG